MESLGLVRLAASLLAPPLCALCGDACRHDAPLCRRCARALAAQPPSVAAPPGAELVVCAAPYEGAAAALVGSLKFAGRLALAALAAERIELALRSAPQPAGGWEGWAVVPVPAAPRRRRARGFDAAEEIAAALARRLGLPLVPCLARADGPRQVGRRRRDRLAAPPRVRATGPAPAQALLVDDVLTTGATLAASATALRARGCERVVAATLARSLASRKPAGA